MRNTALIITGLFALLLFSCDKGDIEIQEMTRGSGVWKIESIVYDTFTNGGSVQTGSLGLSNVGELVFFESPTMNALFAHHLVVANMNDTSGIVICNPGDVYYDDKRMHFQEDPDPDHNFPDMLEGTWTVLTDKRKEKVLTFFETNLNGVLLVKRTMTLKLQKAD